MRSGWKTRGETADAQTDVKGLLRRESERRWIIIGWQAQDRRRKLWDTSAKVNEIFDRMINWSDFFVCQCLRQLFFIIARITASILGVFKSALQLNPQAYISTVRWILQANKTLAHSHTVASQQQPVLGFIPLRACVILFSSTDRNNHSEQLVTWSSSARNNRQLFKFPVKKKKWFWSLEKRVWEKN